MSMLRKRGKMATICDVAKVAGVSPKLFHELSMMNHVRDQTRQRVLKPLKKLDFRPVFSASLPGENLMPLP